MFENDINNSPLVWFFLTENRDDPKNSDGYVCRQLLAHYNGKEQLSIYKLDKFAEAHTEELKDFLDECLDLFKEFIFEYGESVNIETITKDYLHRLIGDHEEELKTTAFVEWFDYEG